MAHRHWHDPATVSAFFRESASCFPDKEAVVAGEIRLTYAQLGAAVSRLAAKLRGLGVQGGRVAMVMGNSAAIVVAYYAIWEAGAQAVPLNPDYTERELSEILEDAEVQVAICGATQQDRVAPLASRLTRQGAIIFEDPEIESLVGAVPEQVTVALPAPEAPGILQYTGGTTGKSKGVMLSHRTVAMNVLQRDSRIPMRPGSERILCVTPLFHAYATAMALFTSLSHGGALIILQRFKPEVVFDMIEQEKVTLFAGAPAIYNALVSHPEFEKRDLSSLSASFSGSAPLAVEVLERWQSVSGAPILEGYGLTEVSPILAFNPRHGVRKPGSVGPAVVGTEIEIVDPVLPAGHLGVGVIGEVRARCPQLMMGYRNRPQETADAVRDGWLHTGDIGELDADGYLFIRGRKKEMVIVGGFNVYPREIEEVLFALKGVKDCGAVGVPDRYRGEVVHVFVVREGGAELSEAEVLAHCTRNLVRYKVPARINFMDDMPRTAVGKLDRLALARIAAAKLQDAQ